MALRCLETFNLGDYVREVRAVGRMALGPRVRTDASSLFRRVREARGVPQLPEDAAATLTFADAVLRPQWSLQLPGGKRYQTYINGSVIDWVLSLGHHGDRVGVLSRCAQTVHRKGRSWQAYERATLDGTTSWNQVDVSPERIALRLAALQKLVGLGDRLGWSAAGEPLDGLLDQPWEAYAREPSGHSAVDFLTTLPQTLQHDEVGFLTCIHIGECCFHAIGVCVSAAVAALRQGDAGEAAASLDQAKPFADAFNLAFAGLATMLPLHFRRFVAATGQASAVQSRRYQELEIVLYGLHPAKGEAMTLFPELGGMDTSRSASLATALAGRSASEELAEVLQAAESLDSSLYRWRARHRAAAHRLYPFSGLELGNGYLDAHYARRLEVRSGG